MSLNYPTHTMTNEKRNVGRPRVNPDEKTQPYTISLTPAEAESIRQIGGGNLTDAIRKMHQQEIAMNGNKLNPNRNKALVDLAEKLFDYHNQHVTRNPELIATLTKQEQENNKRMMGLVDFLSVSLTDHVVVDSKPFDPEYDDPYVSSEERLVANILEFHQGMINEWILRTEDKMESQAK